MTDNFKLITSHSKVQILLCSSLSLYFSVLSFPAINKIFIDLKPMLQIYFIGVSPTSIKSVIVLLIATLSGT